jgi:hypothetical protein
MEDAESERCSLYIFYEFVNFVIIIILNLSVVFLLCLEWDVLYYTYYYLLPHEVLAGEV